MKPHSKILMAMIAVSLMSSQAHAQQLPTHQAGQAKDDSVEVELCDGVTKTEVRGLKPGQPMTHAQALAVTHSLMAEWERKHPGEHWQMAQDTTAGAGAEASPAAEASPEATEAPAEKPSAEPTEAHATSVPQNTKQVISGPGHRQSPPHQQGDTYASFNGRDFKVWKANTDTLRHSRASRFSTTRNLLGGTIGVSCDMCHPDAANTHPETYPKYQVQLQTRGVAARHDRVVHRESGQGQDPGSQRSSPARTGSLHSGAT